jgi:hypothetical protein
MDSKHLVAEFFSHILDHFLNSSFFECSIIKSNGFKTFESKTENASFSIFYSLLAIGVRLEILFKLLLLLEVVLLTFID